MDAGDFDRRITLQRLGLPVDDGFTKAPGAWSPLATVWAQLVPYQRPSKEHVAAGEYSAESYIIWRIRKDRVWADLNAKDQLVYRGVVHNIRWRATAARTTRPHGSRFPWVPTHQAVPPRPSAALPGLG